MRTIHVYNVNGEPYASAAEVVPAVLDKQPAKVVCHSVTTDVQGALLAAIGRAEDSLLYNTMKNAQATLVALSLLILFAWPPIYHAIPMPEITLAVRLATGAVAVLSMLTALIADQKARKSRRRSSKINEMTVTRKDDGLLPRATAWRQLSRRASFPWLALGLILFSIALNCVVLADYVRPAILSNGTVYRTMGLAPPWVKWETGARYVQDNFVVPFGRMWSDPQYVLRISYRIRNLDPDTPIPGLEKWEASLFFVTRYLVGQISDSIRTAALADASVDEIAKDIEVELSSPTAVEAFTSWFNGQVLDKYPNLQLEQVKLSVEIMSQREFNTEYQAQLKRWELQ